jgi:hypothetical protein
MPLGVFTNGREPGRLRGLLMLALTDSGTVLTRVSADDAGGGVTQTWGTLTEGVPCRVDPVGGSGRSVVADRVDERSTHVVTAPPGVRVTADDRFVISGRGTFEVTATRDRTAEHASRFEVLRID